MTRSTTLAVCLLFVVPSAAFAQKKTPPVHAAGDRGSIYVNGGYLAGTSTVSSTVAITVNAEAGSFTSTFHVKAGPALDLGGRVRVWKRISIGAAFTSFSAKGDIDVSAQIPHPFFFHTLRAVEGTTAGEHAETAVHLRAVLTSAPGRKLQYTGFAGPAFFSVRQTLVDRVNYSEAYPFDTATFTSPTVRTATAKKTGIGVGADVAYYFTKNLGAGASATYAKATAEFKAADGSTVSTTVGGAILGVGVRIRF